jgi:hypothetical protein
VRADPRQSSASGKRPAGKGKWVYRFRSGRAEGRADMRDLLGGKGAGLAEMANLGLPVPPGFTITTEVCTNHRGLHELLRERQGLPEAAAATGRDRSCGNRPHHRQGIRRP